MSAALNSNGSSGSDSAPDAISASDQLPAPVAAPRSPLLLGQNANGVEGHRADDVHWMQCALQQAETVAFITSPNPRVGCVIVRDGQCLAQGATQPVGGPHAEVMALRQAAERGVVVEGATVYVSLEPCSHHGRTPPCVDALIAARPARVVVAMLDPNPLVGGQGVARLRAAGIQVTTGVCTDQALAMNPGFVARMVRKTPWVWVKLAASLDGRIALANGQSQWITGPQARADGHYWRARSCVTLTGIGTVLADDPSLTVRDVQTPRVPVRAVVDTHFQLPEQARLIDGHPVLVFTVRTDPEKAARLADRNVQVVTLAPDAKGHVSLSDLLLWLGQAGFNDIHVEAGARLSGALVQSGWCDELLLYMAPKLLGDGLGMVHLPAFDALSQVPEFEFFDHAAVGSDLRVRARHAARWQTLLNAVSVSIPVS